MENNKGKTALRPCTWPPGATSGMNCPKTERRPHTKHKPKNEFATYVHNRGRSLSRCEPLSGLYPLGYPANRSDVPQSLLGSRVEAAMSAEKNRLTLRASSHRGIPRSVRPPYPSTQSRQLIFGR